MNLFPVAVTCLQSGWQPHLALTEAACPPPGCGWGRECTQEQLGSEAPRLSWSVQSGNGRSFFRELECLDRVVEGVEP